MCDHVPQPVYALPHRNGTGRSGSTCSAGPGSATTGHAAGRRERGRLQGAVTAARRGCRARVLGQPDLYGWNPSRCRIGPVTAQHGVRITASCGGSGPDALTGRSRSVPSPEACFKFGPARVRGPAREPPGGPDSDVTRMSARVSAGTCSPGGRPSPSPRVRRTSGPRRWVGRLGS